MARTWSDAFKVARKSHVAGALLAVAIVAAMRRVGLFAPAGFPRGVANIMVFARDFFPPQVTQPADVTRTLLETIEMSFVGTSLSAFLALPVAVLAARNLLGGWLSRVVRTALTLVRTVPVLLWGVLFVVAVGLGPASGTLALITYSFGYLSKLFYEALEGVDPEVLEAVKGAGVSRVQMIRHAVLPEAANLMLSQTLFMFEYNVRASTVLGFVGAGGVGFYMLHYLQTFQYQKLAGVILLTVGVVLGIDILSTRLRSAYLLNGRATRP